MKQLLLLTIIIFLNTTKYQNLSTCQIQCHIWEYTWLQQKLEIFESFKYVKVEEPKISGLDLLLQWFTTVLVINIIQLFEQSQTSYRSEEVLEVIVMKGGQVHYAIS